MNALPPTLTSHFSPRRAGYRALWLAAATWVIGSIAGATVAMANVPVGQWSTHTSPSAAVQSQQSPDEVQRAVDTEALTPGFRSGCQTCGVVENISSAPSGYEFTVRLRDGSTRVSHEANAGKWRVGDPIMLIGGGKPSANTPSSL